MLLPRRSTVAFTACLMFAGTAAASASAATHRPATRFTQIDLVSDLQGRAKLRDPKLVNPWGLSIGPISAVWSSNTGTSSSTFYFGGAAGVIKAPLNVAVQGGAPTGQVYNGTAAFKVKGLPAMFIFSSATGNITGWNLATGAQAVKAAGVTGAVYLGLAMVHTARGPRLLASDFRNARIDAFDAGFRKVALPAGAFKDSALPAGYSPFNVTTVGGFVFVAYAKRDPAGGDEVPGAGLGYVDVYTATGKKIHRFASRGALNAPWAVVKAPSSFGTYAGNILVGNFGDGRINAYTAWGRSRGPLRDASGKPIQIEGLWGLVEGNALSGGNGNLWFAAGIDDERHGLMGLIHPNR